MANRNFPASRVFGFHLMPVRLGCKITIGASGAVASVGGPGIAGVSKVGTGVYRIQLQDNYNSFLHLKANMIQNNVGASSAIDPNAGVVGSLYQIVSLGNTNWATAGIPSGITPTVGQVFALAAAPAAGTGTVKLLINSQIAAVAVCGNPNTRFNSNQPFVAGQGAYITIATMAATSSSVTTLIPTNPAAGDAISVDLLMNNSSIS